MVDLIAALPVTWFSISALIFAKMAGCLEHSERRSASRFFDVLAGIILLVAAVVVVIECGARP